MVDLRLESDEGIVLQASEVERYGKEEYSLDEMVLTNKYIICVYEKSNGLFAKADTIVEKIPLSKIKIAGNNIQVMKIDNDDYGVGMQILFTDGSREHFIFSNNKKEMPVWINAISKTIKGESLEETIQVTEETTKKTVFSTAAMAPFAAGFKEIGEAVKQTANEAKQQISASLQEAGFVSASNDSVEDDEEPVMNGENNISSPKFCVNCGERLKEGAKFCFGCGSPIEMKKATSNNIEAAKSEKEQDSVVDTEKEEELTERKTVYEGKIHKCPSCGEVLGSFQVKCPSCGHEIRDAKNAYSVREFAAKLEEIERGRDKKGFGLKKMLQNQTEVTDVDQRKISLIRSYVIPNTKEDLLEFLVLASSNINLHRYNDFEQTSVSEKAVSDAWEAKFEQAYEKAKLSFGETEEFKKIHAIYEKKSGEIQKSKKNKVRIWIGIIGGIVALYIVLFGIIFFATSSEDRKIKAENERLELIVEEVYDALEDDNYVLARAKAASLVFSGPDNTEAENAAKKWDTTRKELLGIIDAAESGEDVVLPNGEELSGNEENNTNKDTENDKESDKENDISSDKENGNTSQGIVSNSDKSVEVVFQEDSNLGIKEFGWFIGGDYLECIITLTNNTSKKAIEFPTFSVTAYDANGKVMGTEEQVLSVIYPNQEFSAYSLCFEVSEKPTKIVVKTHKPEDYGIVDVSKLDYSKHEQMVGKNVSVTEDGVTGEIYNPNDYDVESAMVIVIFRDSKGNIIGGEQEFIDDIPAGGTTPFEVSMYEDELPEKCEVYAYFW